MSRSFDKLIIFDLDDTLVNTSDVFWRVREAAVKAISHAGFDAESIRIRFEEIENENIIKYGYTYSRYEISFMQLADELHLCDELRSELQDITRELTHKEGIPRLIDGAVELLSWCAERYDLCLLTRGNRVFQNFKIRVNELDQFFQRSNTYVVDVKNANVLMSILQSRGYGPEDAWVIGDSIIADINPALEIGARCIHYNFKHAHYVWTQDAGESISEYYYTVNRLAEAIPIISKGECFANDTSH